MAEPEHEPDPNARWTPEDYLRAAAAGLTSDELRQKAAEPIERAGKAATEMRDLADRIDARKQ